MNPNGQAKANNQEQIDTNEFDKLLENYLPEKKIIPTGQIVKVPVVAIHSDYVLVDIGGKSEGVVNIEEFKDSKGNVTIKVGDPVEVIIGSWDADTGQREVSHTKAKEILAIEQLEKALDENTPVKGVITQEVKGGLIVNVGIPAFLPASQVDLYKAGELSKYIGNEIEALVLEFNRYQKRAILSRRRLLEIIKDQKKAEIYKTLEVGAVKQATVKRIFDFGAFCDIGDGIDGFIPREEVSYDKGSHPSQFLKEGDIITVKIITVDEKNEKIAISRKQILGDPWAKIDSKYPAGKIVEGQVVSIASFGAFVYLEEGITGMIHISDMSWDKKSRKPSDYVKEGDWVKVIVLEYDKVKRRLALGMKQTLPDPWGEAADKFTEGSVVKGIVTSVANFGAFVKLADGIEGLIHVSDMSWEKKSVSPQQVFKVDDEVETIILKVDKGSRRISLGLKQMSENPVQLFIHSHQEGDSVKGKVKNSASFGVFVELAPNVEGLIPVSHLSVNRVENPESLYKVGDEIEAKIIKLDAENEKISLSIKEQVKDTERKEAEAFMGGKNSTAGTNIGDLLNELDFELDESFLSDDESKSGHGKADKASKESAKSQTSSYLNFSYKTPSSLDFLNKPKPEQAEPMKPVSSTPAANEAPVAEKKPSFIPPPPTFTKSTGIYSSILSSIKHTGEQAPNIAPAEKTAEPIEEKSESKKSEEDKKAPETL